MRRASVGGTGRKKWNVREMGERAEGSAGKSAGK